MERPEPNHPTAVLVFSKAPTPGQAKSRLIPALGAEGAARLQRRMTAHIVRVSLAARLGPVTLWCAPDPDHPAFEAIARSLPVALEQQIGPDLGARMERALRGALERYPAAILVGSDCPGIGADDLAEAAARLRVCDAVLGTARDGGYVFIGLRRPERAVFEEIAWGTSGVLDATRARFEVLGWSWHELGPFRDIDWPEDLRHLPPGFLEGIGV